MKKPKITFTTAIKIPLRFILSFLTIPLSVTMGGAFVYMFASESLREKMNEFENSLPIDAMSDALYNFADKYNIGFLKDGFFSDPIMLLLILSLICYIACGGFKEAFAIYKSVCDFVIHLPIKDFYDRSMFINIFLIIALALDLVVIIWGFLILLAFAFPFSLYCSIQMVFVEFGLKAESTKTLFDSSDKNS